LRNRYSANVDGQLQPTNRRVRLADVAERARVSKGTASRVLNGRGELSEQTRTAVLKAAEELRFRPSPLARSLRTRRTFTVGLIVPNVSHAFYAALLQGAQAQLGEAGYSLFLVDSGERDEPVANAIETLRDHQVDGLLISTTPFERERFMQLIGSTPAVFVDEMLPGLGAGSVALENRKGACLLVEHLACHGHERIAFLSGPTEKTSGAERLEGYRTAMADQHLQIPDGFVRECAWTIESGFGETLALLDLPEPPTAIVTASAELALGCLGAARGRGLSVPWDLGLAAFDDIYFSPLLEPAMTAIAYDAVETGARSAELLVDAIAAEQHEHTELRIGVELVVRRSCGCHYDAAAELQRGMEVG
jgi:LacI family transcriptional regulator, galactose operon repressor